MSKMDKGKPKYRDLWKQSLSFGTFGDFVWFWLGYAVATYRVWRIKFWIAVGRLLNKFCRLSANLSDRALDRAEDAQESKRSE